MNRRGREGGAFKAFYSGHARAVCFSVRGDFHCIAKMRYFSENSARMGAQRGMSCPSIDVFAGNLG